MTARAAIATWPRGLSESEAAAYVGVSVNTFRAEVRAGLWPPPLRRGRRVIWDRHLIDRSFDRLSRIADAQHLDLDHAF